VPLRHHELCFGCGRSNLFGLLLEVEQTAPGAVAGRCFIKQDHQGAKRGSAHEGIVAAALSEAMALACGDGARAQTLEVRLDALAPVGTFLDVVAQAQRSDAGLLEATATATCDRVQVAHASGTFRS
jgi:acyl-coenzyme A thioesterase PaaI-like protein